MISEAMKINSTLTSLDLRGEEIKKINEERFRYIKRKKRKNKI